MLGLFVSALLSGIAFWLVADIENHAIERVLQVEMESFRNRKARNPGALPPAASLIQGVFLPSADFPLMDSGVNDEKPFHRLKMSGREFTVMVGDIAGQPYALLYDRTVTDAGLVQLAWALIIGTVLMTGLSALVGHGLAGEVVRPIRRLLSDIAGKSAAVGLAEAQIGFSTANYPDNEIGQLVRALDRFAVRLHGYVQREGYFSADVSHELRTPIAVIRGAAEVLVEHPEFNEPVRERLRAIHRQAVRAGEILEAMLLLGRENGQSGDPACAMAEVVEEAVADCAPWLAGRPVDMVLDLRERPILAVERSLAYVVVSNLMRNACAHTAEGGITVRLAGDRLEIIDTGTGIPQDRFEEIFKRHVKGEESRGSGLGLSIVARITEMLRWQILIDSHCGTGTHVTVLFSVAEPVPPA